MADAKQQHERLPPVLTGKKALIVGVANEHSIAWGCAQAMRRAGAEIAMTYLNDRAKPHVEPLAQAVDAEIFLPLEVRDPAQVDAPLRCNRGTLGRARHPGPLHRLRAAGCAAGTGHGLSARRLPGRHGGLLLVLPRPGAPGRTADAAGRDDDHDVLSRRQRGGRELRHHGPGQGRAGILRSLRGDGAGPEGYPGPCRQPRAAGHPRRLRHQGLRRPDGQGLGAGAGAAARDASRKSVPPASSSPATTPPR